VFGQRIASKYRRMIWSIDRKDVAMGSEDFGLLASDADHRPSAKALV